MADITEPFQRLLIREIGEIAALGPREVSAAYTEFLRHPDATQAELLESRVALAESYQDFAPAVAETGLLAASHGERTSSPLYLAAGGMSAAFALNAQNEQLVLRIPKANKNQSYDSSSLVEHYVDGLIRGVGVNGLEQIRAYSYRDGVTISEFIPGNMAGFLEADEVASITTEQTEQLLDALEVMDQKDLILDSKAGNLMYDTAAGFNIVDYHYQGPERFGLPQTLGEKIASSLKFVTMTQMHMETAEDFEREHQILVAGLAFARTLEQACKRRYPDDSDLLDDLAHKTQQLAERVQVTGDPIWVQSQINRRALRNNAADSNWL
jgi:hypothetical protein